MADKLNLKTLLQDPKMRIMLLSGGIFSIVSIVLASVFFGGDSLEDQKSVTAQIPRSIDVTPGGELPERYRDLQIEENIKRAEEAKKSGESAIPTLVGSLKKYDFDLPDFDSPTPFDSQGRNNNEESTAATPAKSSNDIEAIFDQTRRRSGVATRTPGSAEDAQLAAQRQRDAQAKSRAELLAEQEKRRVEREAALRAERAKREAAKALEKEVNFMQGFSRTLLQAWNTIPTQAYVAGSLKEEDFVSKNQGNETVVTALGDNADTTGANTPQDIIKAGTVYFAVLDTALNTDEPGPILATIVSGKLKGTRLIGSTKKEDDRSQKVTLNFNLMSVPGVDSSLSVSAVAIDPDTARTAMASSVNNHYFMRYSALFASSFLEGYGDAVGNAGTTTTQPDGATVTTKPDLSGTEQFYSALGNVGKEFGKAADDIFNTPTTIKVDQGTGFGLLFLQDAAIPLEDEALNG